MNKLDTESQKVFAANNDFVNKHLAPHVKTFDKDPNFAKIACFYHKEYIDNHFAVTFEPKMRGKTLQEMIWDDEIKNLQELNPILDKIKKTLKILYTLKFNHNDLHSGNVFIEKVDNMLIPTLFDFDWSTFDWEVNDQEYINITYHMIVHALPTIQRNSSPTSIFNAPPATFKKDDAVTQCQYQRGWYEVQNIYSLFANYTKAVTDRDNFIKRTDLTMLLNHILLLLCKKNAQGLDAFITAIVNIPYIDNKTDVTTDIFFKPINGD